MTKHSEAVSSPLGKYPTLYTNTYSASLNLHFHPTRIINRSKWMEIEVGGETLAPTIEKEQANT